MAGGAGAATWTPLRNAAPDKAGTMLLLTDGTVMVQQNGAGNTAQWMKLSPDPGGGYVAGMWSKLAAMGTPRLYFPSHVLPDGRVWVLGGEYSASATAVHLNTGEIYDPVADRWSPIAKHPQALFGDVPTLLLDGGKILAGSILSSGFAAGRSTFLYDIASNTWSGAIPKVHADSSAEESWALMGDGRVLTYDVYKSNATASAIGGGMYAEAFDPAHYTDGDPATRPWVSISPSDGTASGTIPLLGQADGEMGPILRLYDGRMFLIGATGRTALYAPDTRTWMAGPSVPGGLAVNDAPAAILPNGHVILAAEGGGGRPLFDFNPATQAMARLSLPSALSNDLGNTAYQIRLLLLPTGQLLLATASTRLWVYTPDGTPKAAYRPLVKKLAAQGCGKFTLTGKRLTGQSAGAAYGDDAEMDENYPIVRFQDAAGGGFYAKTTHWSTTRIATGDALVTTDFSLPAGFAAGNYQMTVSAAGIQSLATAVNITASQLPSQPGCPAAQ